MTARAMPIAKTSGNAQDFDSIPAAAVIEICLSRVVARRHATTSATGPRFCTTLVSHSIPRERSEESVTGQGDFRATESIRDPREWTVLRKRVTNAGGRC